RTLPAYQHRRRWHDPSLIALPPAVRRGRLSHALLRTAGMTPCAVSSARLLLLEAVSEKKLRATKHREAGRTDTCVVPRDRPAVSPELCRIEPSDPDIGRRTGARGHTSAGFVACGTGRRPRARARHAAAGRRTGAAFIGHRRGASGLRQPGLPTTLQEALHERVFGQEGCW